MYSGTSPHTRGSTYAVKNFTDIRILDGEKRGVYGARHELLVIVLQTRFLLVCNGFSVVLGALSSFIQGELSKA